MRQDRLGLFHGAEFDGFVCHVLDENGGHAALLLGLVDEGGGAGSSTADQSRVGRSNGRFVVAVDGSGSVMQFGESVGEILGVDKLVGCVLESNLPAVRRARGRGDEEKLAGVGQREVLVLLIHGCRSSKIDLALVTHDKLIIPDLSHGDGRLLVKEGDDDAAERLERGEGMDGGGVGDEVADSVEVLGEEDGGIGQVGEEQGVGGRRGRRERWEGRKIETEIRPTRD